MANAFTPSLRLFAGDRFYKALNISGLAVGFTAAILLFLFVHYELTYDRFLPGFESTYLLVETIRIPGQTPISTPAIQANMGKLLKEEFPEVEAIARLCADRATLRRGDFESDEKVYWADPNIFEVLKLRAIEGNLNTALDSPDSIVMTSDSVRKYFGRDDPIGKTLLLDGKHPLRVTAVLADLPPNTHLDLAVIASGRSAFSQLRALDTNPNTASVPNLVYTYLRLWPGAPDASLAPRLPAFIAQRVPRLSARLHLSLRLIRVDQVHLTSVTEESMRPIDSKAAIYGLLLVGMLIVTVASINFVNLLTARATRRANEVAIRKTVGASRLQLIILFMSETAVQAVLAMVIAVALAELALGRFNGFLGTQIQFTYWRDPALAAGLLVAAMLVGALAGIYPALVLSAFQPAVTLNGGSPGVSSPAQVRTVLVTLQFAVLIALAVASVVIYRQVDYALHQGLRVDQDQVISISTSCQGAFPDAVRALPSVRAAACAWSGSLNLTEEAHWPLRLPDGALIPVDGDSVGYEFFQLYGLTPLAGRFFSRAHPADTVPADFISVLVRNALAQPDHSAGIVGNMVINEAATRLAGFHSPNDAIGKTLYAGGQPLEIIGVVRDFSFASVKRAVPPTFFVVFPSSFDQLSVKLAGTGLGGTITAINRLWRDTGELVPMRWFFMSEHMRALYDTVARLAQSLAVFCAITVLIACLGLFGLAAYTAQQRRAEIGIRKALGAGRYDILKLALWQFIRPIAFATAVAWPVAYVALQHWLSGFAYHIRLDPLPFLFGSFIAAAVALATVSAHALSMALDRPSAALRHE